MTSALRSVIKSAARALGFDVVRFPALGEATLLGLTRFRVGTVIDVGAHIGQFARTALRAFPAARIYSFEPQPEPYADLARWIGEERAGRVLAFQIALGETEGELEMKVHTARTEQNLAYGSSSFLQTTETCHTLFPFTKEQSSARVRMSTLDGFMAGEALTPDIVIKMDVQGYEDRVLRGGEATLAKTKACVLEVSLDPLYEGQATFEGLFRYLTQRGFSYAGNLSQVLARDGHVAYLDAVFVR